MSMKVSKSYSSNFNKATFNGNLPKNPRLISFTTRGGKTVQMTYFRVLSDDYFNGYKTTSEMDCIAFGQHAVNIAKNFNRGDFVEANSTINTFPAKHIQGQTLKYPVTITRFNVYSLKNLRKSPKKSASQAKPSDKQPATKPQSKPKTDNKAKASQQKPKATAKKPVAKKATDDKKTSKKTVKDTAKQSAKDKSKVSTK